jgi:hypothetical protein
MKYDRFPETQSGGEIVGSLILLCSKQTAKSWRDERRGERNFLAVLAAKNLVESDREELLKVQVNALGIMYQANSLTFVMCGGAGSAKSAKSWHAWHWVHRQASIGCRALHCLEWASTHQSDKL